MADKRSLTPTKAASSRVMRLPTFSSRTASRLDGKGAWRDNVFVERFCRTVRYEEVYLKAYESVAEARSSIGGFLEFYNGRRPHSALDRRTPDQAYCTWRPRCVAA